MDDPQAGHVTEPDPPLFTQGYHATAAFEVPVLHVSNADAEAAVEGGVSQSLTSVLNEAAATILNPAHELAARASLCKVARWGYAHEHSIHYTKDQRRDDWLLYPSFTLPPGGIWTDCSGWVTLAMHWVGLADPSGFGYRWVGNSTSITAHSLHIHPKQAKPGDMVAYGPAGNDHVVLITGARQDGSVLVCSHGWEGGPQQRLQIQEQDSHRLPATWLRNRCFAPPAV